MTESAFAIVRARTEDLPEVRRLAGVIWRAHYPGIIPPEQIEYMLARGYALEALAQFIDGPGRGLELAVVDGAIAGFAGWFLTDDPATAKLDKLYVVPERHRAGVGRRLFERVDELAGTAGACTLILNVNKYNAKAIAAYERWGFAVRQSVVVDIGRGFVMDDYVMARPIGAASVPG